MQNYLKMIFQKYNVLTTNQYEISLQIQAPYKQQIYKYIHTPRTNIADHLKDQYMFHSLMSEMNKNNIFSLLIR